MAKNTIIHIPKIQDPQSEFWDPLPLETSEEYSLFDAWRKSGLHISDFARKKRKRVGLVWEIAARNEWKDRKMAWHTWQNAIERQAFARQAKRFARKAFAKQEELDILDGARLLIQASIDDFLIKGKKLTPAEFISLLDKVIKARQIVEHQATEVVKVIDPDRLSNASTADLEELHKALKKLD
jgi:hypothetical protein